MRRRTSSSPDWIGRLTSSQTFGNSAIAALVDRDALGDTRQADRLLRVESVPLRQVQQVDQTLAHRQVLARLRDQVDEWIALVPVWDITDAAGHDDLHLWSSGLHFLQC